MSYIDIITELLDCHEYNVALTESRERRARLMRYDVARCAERSAALPSIVPML